MKLCAAGFLGDGAALHLLVVGAEGAVDAIRTREHAVVVADDGVMAGVVEDEPVPQSGSPEREICDESSTVAVGELLAIIDDEVVCVGVKGVPDNRVRGNR